MNNKAGMWPGINRFEKIVLPSPELLKAGIGNWKMETETNDGVIGRVPEMKARRTTEMNNKAGLWSGINRFEKIKLPSPELGKVEIGNSKLETGSNDGTRFHSSLHPSFSALHYFNESWRCKIAATLGGGYFRSHS